MRGVWNQRRVTGWLESPTNRGSKRDLAWKFLIWRKDRLIQLNWRRKVKNVDSVALFCLICLSLFDEIRAGLTIKDRSVRYCRMDFISKMGG